MLLAALGETAMSVWTFSKFFLQRYILKLVYSFDVGIYSCIYQKQSLRVVPGKSCSENMQQIYRRTPMPPSVIS